MKLFIVAVRDTAADVYGQPNFVPSIGSYVRNFTDEVNRDARDNVLFNHPEDFIAFELGVYDDSNASFALLKEPRQLARGQDLKRSKE